MYVYVSLQDEGTSISIVGISVWYLHFVHNIDFIQGTGTELKVLTNKHDSYGIKLNKQKFREFVNGNATQLTASPWRANNRKCFKYMGETLSNASTCHAKTARG